MIVLVLNCGSSSIKYQLINMQDETLIAKGGIERIGLEGAFLKHTPAGKESVVMKQPIPDHKVGVELVLRALVDKEHGVIPDMGSIAAVGHRVVHGGERFSDSVLITPDVLKGIEDCNEMAPLHNPANVIGIRACLELMPKVPQVAVFDTAFHQTMPKEDFLFGLPYEYYEKYGLRRYGFHGTSHKYVSAEAARVLGKPLEELKIVTCHLGNGSSVCAVKKGKSMDTSMGFTPLDGLIMGTRCGELDPAVLGYVMHKEHLSIEEMGNVLNKKSGVLGISGVSSDFRDLEEAQAQGNQRAALALNIFALKVKKYIGSYAAEMGGLDAVVFTAGVGENGPDTRAAICSGLEFLGVAIDPERNKVRGKLREISPEGAKVKVLVIPTNEELVIARDTKRLCRNV